MKRLFTSVTTVVVLVPTFLVAKGPTTRIVITADKDGRELARQLLRSAKRT